MMCPAGLYCVIILTVSLVTVLWASCTTQIACPCGNTRREFYYTHCLNNTSEEEYTCERWANCETCRANITHCLTCPPGRSGPTCAEAGTSTRKKRAPSVVKVKKTKRGRGYKKFGKRKGRTCPDPGIPKEGNRQNEYGADKSDKRFFSEGESVYFSCNDANSVLRGKTAITCTSFGNWSDSLPWCEKTSEVQEETEICPDPGIPEGASRVNINGTDETANRVFQEDETVYFSCNEADSVLQGNDVITCTSFGNWSDSLPWCEKAGKTCPDPGIPEGGKGASRENFDGRNESAQRTFQEGERLYFYCNEEESFEIVGEYIINCTSFGNWSDSLPSCQEVTTCPDPGIPEGGRRQNADETEEATVRAFREGESVHFFCNGEDSILNGTQVLYCTQYGTWSHSLPECEKGVNVKSGTCTNPGTPEGTIRQIMDGSEGSEVFQEGVSINFYCNDLNYELKGNPVITCTPYGTWSHELPQCEKFEVKQCPDPGIPEGASREIVGGTDDAPERVFLEREYVQFACNEKDSVLKGDNTIYCTSLGTWSGQLPKCEKIETAREKSETCDDPGTPEDGIRQDAVGIEVVAERSFEEGESLYFYCKGADYILKGDNHITCTPTGWSGPLPRCEKTVPNKASGNPCKHPGDVANGWIENIGGPGSLEDKQQAFPPATRLKFHCKEGYKLEGGERILFCLCSGKWTSSPPACVSEVINDGSSSSVHCKSPGLISNGEVNQIREMERQLASAYDEYDSSYFVGTRLHYNCNEGYVLKGAKTVVCESSGLWSSPEPKCIKGPNVSNEGEEPIRSTNARRGNGKPNSLIFNFYF